jgi:hypothetical protein
MGCGVSNYFCSVYFDRANRSGLLNVSKDKNILLWANRCSSSLRADDGSRF